MGVLLNRTPSSEDTGHFAIHEYEMIVFIGTCFFIAAYACLWNCFSFVMAQYAIFYILVPLVFVFQSIFLSVLPNVGINFFGCSIAKGIVYNALY